LVGAGKIGFPQGDDSMSKKKPPQEPEQVPPGMKATYDAVVAATDAFCREHLNEEYAALCRKLAAALCRKSPSPLKHGKIQSWVAGIIYELGQLNFLMDPSQKPHVTTAELCARLGVGQSTAQAKAKEIRRLIPMRRFDQEWNLPSRWEQSPLAWMIEVNGLPMDARHAPRPIQEEAFRLGFIPYIPGEK
jgi:hypothetical protein